MKKLILIFGMLTSINSFAQFNHKYYHPMPEGVKVRVTLESITLPAHADRITFLGIGSNDFHMYFGFDAEKSHILDLPENDSALSRTDEIDLSINLTSDHDFNPYINTHSYSKHKSIWLPKSGKICLWNPGMIRENFGCFSVILTVNKMLNSRKKTTQIIVSQRLRDSGGEADSYFKDPIVSTYRVEIL